MTRGNSLIPTSVLWNEAQNFTYSATHNAVARFRLSRKPLVDGHLIPPVPLKVQYLVFRKTISPGHSQKTLFKTPELLENYAEMSLTERSAKVTVVQSAENYWFNFCLGPSHNGLLDYKRSPTCTVQLPSKLGQGQENATSNKQLLAEQTLTDTEVCILGTVSVPVMWGYWILYY